jgi:hypothetical protein
MGMKASEVGAWLRKSAGKRDHHELLPEDYVVVRPGPNFDWFMGHGGSPQTEPLLPAPEHAPTGDDCRGAGAKTRQLRAWLQGRSKQDVDPSSISDLC